MAGSFDLSGGIPSLGGPAAPVYVCRLDGGKLTWLPNIVCVGVHESAGPTPPSATFRYLFDDAYRSSAGWPGRIEDVWPIDASGPYVVSPDDRIVCFIVNPDQTTKYLFDGFAQIPQADLSPSGERATFTATGVAIREFDNPISGRVQRNGDTKGIQDTSGKSDIDVDLPCRFNPADSTYGDDGGYRPNKTPDDYDTNDGTAPAHPVFAESNIKGRPDSQSPQYWTIPDAIKFLLAEYNPKGKYTQYPALSTLDDLLSAVYEDDDNAGYQLNNINRDPLLIRDFDASNRPWPEAVAELLSYAGFTMRWDLDTGTNGGPTTYLRFYRKDMLSTSPTRPLYLDKAGNSLAAGSQNNVVQLHLARDGNAIVNAWQVETSQRQVECSFYLCPLYQPSAGDASSSSRDTFKLSALEAAHATAANRRKYRWYGVDELGEGYWNAPASTWKTGITMDFSQVFPPDSDGNPAYVVRYRPAVSGQAAAQDDQKKPLKARLDIGFGVSVPGPAFASNSDSVTWIPVLKGWQLLKDRLGIEVIAEDAEQWSTGGKDLPNGGDIRGISWWATPPSTIKVKGKDVTTNGYPPTLRLTVVIEDDLRMPISAGKRPGSPTQFARWRVVDARDHFQYVSIDPSSANFASAGGSGTTPVVVRDDTKAATDHARSKRSAHEMPPLAGSVTLPGIVTQYEVGDRVKTVIGRGINLGQSAATASGEATTYPTIVARSFDLDGRYYTSLQLSDARGEKRHNAW